MEKILATELGAYGDEAETVFRRRVYAEQMARRERGKSFHPGLGAEDLAGLEGPYLLHADAAADARALLAQARADLAAAQAAGDGKAISVTFVGVDSAYRSPRADFDAWQEAFDTHYRGTRAHREGLPGGALGDEAVAFLAQHLATFKAVPGFSNHTHGRAIDFATGEQTVTLGADSSQRDRWLDSWLWQWLNANAPRFRFHPYLAEPWHWDHR